MSEDQRMHLQLIQDVISRMASNSFAMKGWSVTVTAALIALSAKDANASFAIVALYPAMSFWGLDSYYLRQERRFRELYDAVREGKAVSMMSLNPTGWDQNAGTWLSSASSGTILALHLPIIAAVLGVLLYSLCH